MLALEDLKGQSEKQVKEHLANNYSGNESGFSSGDIKNEDIKDANNALKNKKILIAYESVGSWGCDSSSFFLMKDKTNGKLYEVHGSHCSCYGFEGQLKLEETTRKALKARNENGVFYTGGYDDHEDENKRLVKEFIDKLV